MTKKDIIELMEDMPDDRELGLSVGDGILVGVCFLHSVEVEVLKENGTMERLFLLQPCTCDIEQDFIADEVNLN